MKLPLLAMLMLVAGALFAMAAPKVFAASSNLPDSSIGGGNWQDKFLVVSRAGVGNALQAPNLYVKVYFRNSSGSIDIHDADFCGSAGVSPDGTTPLLNRYELFRTGGDEKYNNLGSPVTQYISQNRQSSAGHCIKNSSARRLTISGLTPSAIPGRNGESGSQQYYVAVLRVSIASGSVGVNAFKLSSPSSGAIVGYAVNSMAFASGGFCDYYTASSPCYNWGPYGTIEPSHGQDAFAIQDRYGANSSYSSFSLEFAPDCKMTAARTVNLKWKDLDVGVGNQGRTPVMRLMRQPRGGGAETQVGSAKTTFLTGDNVYDKWSVTITPGYRYRWVWEDIQKTNGVQLWLPFDSANFNFGCPPANDAECSLASVPSRVRIGQTFNAHLRVQNTGMSNWNDTYRLSTGHRSSGEGVAPEEVYNNRFWRARSNGNNTLTPTDASGGNRVYFSYPFNSGQTQDVRFAAQAPDTPGQYIFAWRVVREGVAFMGDPCITVIDVYDARNRPYLGVIGGDVISGARFRSSQLGSQECAAATGAARSADIKTNGFYGVGEGLELFLTGARGTSMSQYGVMASGIIGDDDNYGASNTFLGNFGYRRPALNGVKDALFANDGLEDTGYGRYYADTPNAALPCVDVASMESGASALAAGSVAAFLASNESGSRVVSSGNISLNAATIPAGTKKTIIVQNGSVTINGDIRYAGSASYASNTAIPQLNIIAQNVYINVAARHIDANLYAMPTAGGGAVQQNGILDTCVGLALPAGVWPSALTIGTCQRYPDATYENSLTINGQVVARRILWKRTGGTLDGRESVQVATCYVANWGDPSDPPVIVNQATSVTRFRRCAAELIDANPERYISGFDGGMSVGDYIQSTKELPPIY